MGPADPVVRPAHECRRLRRVSSWTLPGGPPTCVCRCQGFVRQFSLSNGPILKVKSGMGSSVCFSLRSLVFSSYFTSGCLQIIIHQSSWNSFVITPTTTIDVHSSCLYAGIDGIYFALKDRQQVSPHLIFARPPAKSYVTMKHEFKKCDASIKVIPCHSSYLWIFVVSTMSH